MRDSDLGAASFPSLIQCSWTPLCGSRCVREKAVNMARGVKFPPGFRQEAISLRRSNSRSLRATAEEIGICPDTPSSWMRQDDIGRSKAAWLTSEERMELRRLRARTASSRRRKRSSRKQRFSSPGRQISGNKISTDRRREDAPPSPGSPACWACRVPASTPGPCA